MFITRDFHFYYEIIVFILSWILGITVLKLVKTKTPKYLRSYSKMIMLNTTVDLFFTLVSVILMGTLDVQSGLLYIVVDNPYHPVNATLGAFTASFWTFSLYLTVIAIPLQFIYRYGIIARYTPYSKREITSIIAVFFVYIALHAGLCPVTMNTMSKQYDDMLTVNPIFKDRLPNAYLVGDTTTSIPYFFHALHCQVVLIVCYIVTIIFGFKTWKAMAENHLDLTPEREEMQREISRIMILQAIYPVIAMGIPLFALAAVPFLNGGAADFYWLGMVGIGLINIIPILNSLSVIFVIPQYRKAVIGQ